MSKLTQAQQEQYERKRQEIQGELDTLVAMAKQFHWQRRDLPAKYTKQTLSKILSLLFDEEENLVEASAIHKNIVAFMGQIRQQGV